MLRILAESFFFGTKSRRKPSFFSSVLSALCFLKLNKARLPSFPWLWLLGLHFLLHFKVAGACRELPGLMPQSSVLGMCFKYRNSNARCVWINTRLQHIAVATHRRYWLIHGFWHVAVVMGVAGCKWSLCRVACVCACGRACVWEGARERERETENSELKMSVCSARGARLAHLDCREGYEYIEATNCSDRVIIPWQQSLVYCMFSVPQFLCHCILDFRRPQLQGTSTLLDTTTLAFRSKDRCEHMKTWTH